MKPRALVLDIFGDYRGIIGTKVRLGDLVAMLGVLGVEPPTTRITLSRLKQEGWFTTTRVGRETEYQLSNHILGILTEGRERIFAPYQTEWDGWWTQLVFQIPEGDRALRDQIKKRLSWLGFGSLTTSTWLSPRERRQDSLGLRVEFPTVDIDVLTTSTGDVAEDRSLASRCWDLEALNADYRAFISEHRQLRTSASRLDGRSAFAARIELISTYRHFPFRDPSLPTALRPSGWLGADAQALFLEIHDALRGAAEEFVTETVSGRGLGQR